MKDLKAFKSYSLFAFFLMSLCVLLSNEVSAQDCSWNNIAIEGETLNLKSTQVVRYGTATQYVEKTVPSGTKCSNTVFGDPAPGAHKLCSICEDEAALSCWKIIAAEHQRLNLTGTQTVRFGTSTKYVEKEVPNGAKCNSATFGSDPAPGKRKQCSVCDGI